MNERLTLIEAPFNLGLKEPQKGTQPGVRFFPEMMEQTGLANQAGIKNIINIPAPEYVSEIDPETRVRNAPQVIAYNISLAEIIGQQHLQKQIPVVIGGDCSILIGAGLAMKRQGRYALFFLDGHTDYVLPHQSGTGGAAGMDLAIVTGNGPEKLTNLDGLQPYFLKEDVFCVGNRDLSEDWYVRAIKESNIHYYDLYAVRENGCGHISQSFLHMMEEKKLDGCWIHFDVDVLHNDLMPCVDSPQAEGLNYVEIGALLQPILGSAFFRGVDVTIYDPALDKDGFYGSQLAKELGKLIHSIK